MGRVPIRELNQHTSAVLARVQHGEIMEVTLNGRVVARIMPISPAGRLLDRLVAEGQAIAPTVTGRIPRPPVLGDRDINVAEELAAARLEERW